MDSGNDDKATQQIIVSEGENTRADEMWSIITNHVEFKNKVVGDFGCGYGDFVWRAINAGAERVLAFDTEQKFEIIMPYDIQISFIKRDLNTFFEDLARPIHIGFCFSVFPYLKYRQRFMYWLARNVRIALIEVQYISEPYNIGVKDDDEMCSLLLAHGFDFVVPIGKTEIKDRNTHRTIWMCT